MRHGKRLGITEPFLWRLVEVLVREMGAAYPELPNQREYLERMIRTEEERFESVLTTGLPRLEEALDRAAAANGIVPGDEAFRLYDTFGVPVDFIEDMATERKLRMDAAGFDRAMEAQKEKARAQSAFATSHPEGGSFDAVTEPLRGMADQFEGYTETRVQGIPVLAVLNEKGRPAAELAEGDTGYVALGRTPFYVESGGQVSDSGTLTTDSGTRAVVDGLVKAGTDRPRLHHVRVESGMLRERDLVNAEVDVTLRDATRRKHTATHLLHAALRTVLGSHVKQGGSLVSPDRLRFDFIHYEAMTREQLDEVERIVNAQIWRNTPVETEVRATEEAIIHLTKILDFNVWKSRVFAFGRRRGRKSRRCSGRHGPCGSGRSSARTG
jgi:alanyl-tRNA synthetase